MKAQSVTRKHVTPKWVDRLLIGFLVLIPVLFVAGYNLNYGPSMFRLGFLYRTSWGEQPTRVGQIVRFAQPSQPKWRKYILPTIKRVAEIQKDGYFVEGDNEDESLDSRDWRTDIPPDHVGGVVVTAISLSSVIRGFTTEGRLKNYLSLNLAPNSYKANGKLVAAWFPTQSNKQGRTGMTRIYKDGVEVRSFQDWTIFSWRDNMIVLGHFDGRRPVKSRWEYIGYDPVSKTVTRCLDRYGNRRL